MAEITASSVMKLRKISGQGMMDCKKALGEAEGDIDKALEILRKKGLATLAKRAGRTTSEGIVIGRVSEDGKTGVLVSLCCETDFVAKSTEFIAAGEVLADCAMVCEEGEGVENILESAIDGKKFGAYLNELVSKTGEKTEVGDYSRYKLDGAGFITIYIHFNKKVGTMLQIDAGSQEVAGSEVLRQAAADVAMHITALNPLALDEKSIPAEVIEQEKAIYAEQVKNKPANIVEKIVAGKLKKFFSEKCLLSQAFVKDDSKTVGEVIRDAGKVAGGEAKVSRFVRFGIG